ncbi:hypothetical protein SSX86_025283 [Deinandra increscens subsp. villosa]|uniref:Uncharacterized protein n=1 Tax=Deinandra increscens subsp. villosa TaxID=3103831 RepID=A0AAP0CD18_9ASTR
MYHPDTDWPIDAAAAAAAAELTWTRYEDKLFEEALLMYPDDVIGRWQKIADAVPGFEFSIIPGDSDSEDVREVSLKRMHVPFQTETPVEPPSSADAGQVDGNVSPLAQNQKDLEIKSSRLKRENDLGRNIGR